MTVGEKRKTIRVPMRYRPDGSRVWWTVRRERGTDQTGKQPWTFTDHDGYERHGGYTWLELVERFRSVADNYNMETSLS